MSPWANMRWAVHLAAHDVRYSQPKHLPFKNCSGASLTRLNDWYNGELYHISSIDCFLTFPAANCSGNSFHAGQTSTRPSGFINGASYPLCILLFPFSKTALKESKNS